jgi:hypothetical protein
MIDIVTTVLTREGQQIAQSVQAHDSSELSGDKRALRYMEFVPLSRLVPAGYVPKVEARSSLLTGRSTTRYVPFRVVSETRASLP